MLQKKGLAARRPPAPNSSRVVGEPTARSNNLAIVSLLSLRVKHAAMEGLDRPEVRCACARRVIRRRYRLRTPSVILWPCVGVDTTATIRGGVWLLVIGWPGVGVTSSGDAGVEFAGAGAGAGPGEPAGGFELGWSAIAYLDDMRASKVARTKFTKSMSSERMKPRANCDTSRTTASATT